MRYILTESQYAELRVRRRIEQVKGLIKDLYAYSYPCDYDDFDSFLFSIIYGIKHELSLDWFDEDIEEFVEELIRKVMRKEILEYYMSKCSNSEARKMEQNEGELTEKFCKRKNNISESIPDELKKRYIDKFVSRNEIHNLGNYIVISQETAGDDWIDYIEYDFSDGRLWINRDVVRRFSDWFGEDDKETIDFFKNWFEKRFDVDIKYTEF